MDGNQQHQQLIDGTGGETHASSYYLQCLIHMSVCFFLVFTAFSGLQNLESSFLNNDGPVGSVSVGVLYFVFMLSCLSGPAIVKTLKARWSLVAAFVCFVLYGVGNVVVIANPGSVGLAWAMLLLTGALTGFGASFLWTAQGTYLTACGMRYARSKGEAEGAALGLFNGIFFCIFQLTQISGNLLESLMYHPGGTAVPLFSVYLGCMVAGTLFAVFLRPVSPIRDSSQTFSVRELMLNTVQLWRDSKLWFIVPACLFSGLEQGFAWGQFTASFVTPSLGKQNIGYVMACFGAADAISSFVMGRLSDTLGRRPIFAIGFVLQAVVIVYFLVVGTVPEGDWVVLMIAAALWGIGDAVWNTQISATLGAVFADRSEAAFANFKLWQSLATAASFFYSSAIHSNLVKLMILLVVLPIGTGMVLTVAGKTAKAEQSDHNSDSEHAPLKV